MTPNQEARERNRQIYRPASVKIKACLVCKAPMPILGYHGWSHFCSLSCEIKAIAIQRDAEQIWQEREARYGPAMAITGPVAVIEGMVRS